MKQSQKLRHKLFIAFVSVLITFVVVVSVTFAWYIYNTNRHTTNVHMAAGAGGSIQISNSYDGAYGQSAVLDAFVGMLNPVSTNRISGGFQKVFGYTNGSENQSNLVANLFGSGVASDYYKTSLFIKTDGGKNGIYLSDIGYSDSDKENPISTAIRVGLVVHQPGKNKSIANEFIFAINQDANPSGEYNTATGKEGYVLDCTKKDGTTVPFSPYTSKNYCEYNSDTGITTLSTDSKELFTIEGNGNGAYGEAVQVDVYIWLEGCDRDCTNNLGDKTLKNLAVSFAGYTKK